MNTTLWTIDSYAFYNEKMREMDGKLNEERDRRYSEVNVEKEKALKIKETADLTALELARESQVYKDERNDSTREQNLKENGRYATREDLTLVFAESKKTMNLFMDEMRIAFKPMADHLAADTGGDQSTKKLYANITVIVAILGAVFMLISYMIK